jgi:hypothetical protein
MTEYTYKLLIDNMYEIETVFNGEPVTFSVVVANDESELDRLVDHHLNYLANPTPVYVEPNPIQETVEEKLARSGLTIDELKEALGL